MPVDTIHPDHQAFQPRWRDLRHAFGGEPEVKAAGELHLPRLGGLDPDGRKYAAYLKRAIFPDFVADTHDAFLGQVFRKPVEVSNLPPALEDHYWSNVDGMGNGVDVLAKSVISEVLLMGRYGVLVDMPNEDALFSQAIPARFALPIAIGFTTEQIINWIVQFDGSILKILRVVLQEEREVPREDDKFQVERISQYRVLELNELGQYQHQLFVEMPSFLRQGRARELVVSEPIVPLRFGQPLSFIPFMFFGPDDILPHISRSPLEGVACAAYSYYRNSADLEHGRHFTSLPTAIISDTPTKNDPTTELLIGGSTAWKLSTEGTATFLEYRGDGLGSLERALQEKTQRAGSMAARSISEPRGVESAETAQIRRAGETSRLASVANTTANGLTGIAQFIGTWMGFQPQVVRDFSTTLNTDYSLIEMDPQLLGTLLTGVEKGLVPREVLFFNMRQGELLDTALTFEEYERLLTIIEQPSPTNIPAIG